MTSVCAVGVRSKSRGRRWGAGTRTPASAGTRLPHDSHGWFPAACQPAIMFNKGPKLDSPAQAPSL